MSGEWMTPDEAAVELKLPASTVRQFCRQGRIRALKVGRQWRFTRSAFEAFLRGCAA